MNQKNVFIVYNDTRKDFSAAEKYGQLRDIYSSLGRQYNGDKLIEHARRVLRNWQPGDYLLMVGDPTLCAICMSVILEKEGEIDVLRWDRNQFEYAPLKLNFDYNQPVD